MADQDYYKTLKVPEDADTEQIKAAYRQLALQYHPDKNVDNPQAAEKMQQINEAYAVLSDPQKRDPYDNLRHQYGPTGARSRFRQTWSEQEIFENSDIRNVFDELAKSFGFRDFDDLSKEVFQGKIKPFEFTKPGINVKGVFFSGSFNLGKGGLKKILPTILGKLAGVIGQSISQGNIPHKSADLHDTITIDPDLAKSGGPFAYFHKWHSKKLIVMIPPNTRNGNQIRLAGMGEKGSEEELQGDLYIRIETGNSLADKLKQIFPF